MYFIQLSIFRKTQYLLSRCYVNRRSWLSGLWTAGGTNHDSACSGGDCDQFYHFHITILFYC